MTSPDGITWTARTAGAVSDWYSVCWSPELSLFVAVACSGTDRVMTSPDGTNWTARTAGAVSSWDCVCWSPELSLFVAVAYDGTDRVMTSPGVVGIPLAGHGYNTGDQILLNGTVNYDGVYTVLATSVAGRIDITANYVAETFAGTETACIIIETTTHTLSGTRTYNRFWQEYTNQGAVHTTTIKLTTTATTVQAGVIKAGVAVDFKNPQYGISEYPIDYSTVEELSNGAKYVKSRDIIRGFNVTIDVVRASDFYNLWDIIVAYGKTPMAALMAEGIIDSQWCVFGTIESFSGTHQHPIDSVVSLTFEEVV